MNTEDLVLVAAAFALGGILKGVTGAGAPIIAVPVLVVLKDVQFAVAVFVMSNIVPNLWQAWSFRRAWMPGRFPWYLAVSGGVGVGFGTIALAEWSPDVLTTIMAVVLIAYILFRIMKPVWELPLSTASWMVVPVGVAAGALQGAAGVSAPISITFLNALRLRREQFMVTISMFFIALGVVQLPLQIAYGVMTIERFIYSMIALIPLLAFMPVGNWIGRRISRRTFDRLLLAVLSVLAVKLLGDSFFQAVRFFV